MGNAKTQIEKLGLHINGEEVVSKIRLHVAL